MSIARAFEIVRQSLPAAIAERVSEKLVAVPSSREIALEGFALFPVTDAKNLKFILERRAISSPVGVARQATQEKHDFVAKALREETQKHLWQGYVVIDGKHSSLLVNLATAEMLKVCLG